jgi:hypothetical protein
VFSYPLASLARRQSHNFFGILFTSYAVVYALEYITSLYLLSTSKAAADRPPALAKLHPAYTNQELYKTVFPMLSAYVMLVNGVYWMNVSFSLFLEVPDNDTSAMFHEEHMVMMEAAEMIYSSLLFTAVGMGIIAFALRYLERGVAACSVI